MSFVGTPFVVLKGDWRGKALWFGVPYTFRYEFSPVLLRQPGSLGGIVSVNTGRTQVKNFSVDFSNTGYFRSEVTPLNRDTFIKTFTGSQPSELDALIGGVSIENGRFRFPVQSKNDQVGLALVNDSILPSWFVSADWEGEFTTRAKRI